MKIQYNPDCVTFITPQGIVCTQKKLLTLPERTYRRKQITLNERFISINYKRPLMVITITCDHPDSTIT